MKRGLLFIFVLSVLSVFTACGSKKDTSANVTPNIFDMKEICELATMDCYYHNVAKYEDKDAEGFLFWKKDKHFWIEYDGVVTIGIDASLVKIEVEDTLVTVTMPPAKVFGCTVDSSSLTKDSFIVDINSAPIDADDENAAFADAEKNMLEDASNNTVLMRSAQNRAKALLQEYINDIGDLAGKEYRIEWIELEENF